MRYENFTMRSDGFVGHLAEPDSGSDRAVIVIMGGEQSIMPGIKFAERFADYGITGLAVSLFGAEGLPDSPDRIPLDMFVPAVKYLRDVKHAESRFTPTALHFDREGGCALLCDDEEDADDGIAVCIIPEKCVVSQDDYL